MPLTILICYTSEKWSGNSRQKAHKGMKTRILLADDEASVRQLLQLVLESQDYEVAGASSGDELIRLAQERPPDLILVDVMMPRMDGYEAIRQLRNDTRTAHLPMMILTSKSAPGDLVEGFNVGADDFVTKPFDIPELLARIRGLLRRAKQPPVHNQLTNLPGNTLIMEELRRRVTDGQPFAMLYVDLDHFKVFNDTYGFARGDRAIVVLAEIIQRTVDTHGAAGDFVGHVGGDDFAVLTRPERFESICRELIRAFDVEIRKLYDREDLERGYLWGTDRHGILRSFPVMSVTIAVVTNQNRRFDSADEVSEVAATLKKRGKGQPGSGYVVDQRAETVLPVQEDRRGSSQPVLLICKDSSLRRTIYRTLEDHGYRTLEAGSVLDAHAVLAHEPRPSLVIADSQLNQPFWNLYQQIRRLRSGTKLIMLVNSNDEAVAARNSGATLCLQEPFSLDDFLDHVQDLAAA
jgi:DNA-binding response OmpR family regulator